MKRGEWAILHRETIPAPNGEPYIDRFRIVMTPFASLYIHHIHKSDEDRDLHDHPAGFISWILRGGYVERIADVRAPTITWVRSRARWSLHRHPLQLCHRIEVIAPRTVTLVLTGRRRQNWGFYTPSGYVSWERYER